MMRKKYIFFPIFVPCLSQKISIDIFPTLHSFGFSFQFLDDDISNNCFSVKSPVIAKYFFSPS